MMWNENCPSIVYHLALLGYTDKKIALAFQVEEDTIHTWKRNHPEFMKSMEMGKLQADSVVVENFYMNCIDRWVEQEEVHVVKGEIKKVKVRKFIQGDKWAQAKWMSLRQRGEWSEVARVEVMNTNVNINKLDFSGLSLEEVKLIEQIQLKQLSNSGGN